MDVAAAENDNGEKGDGKDNDGGGGLDGKENVRSVKEDDDIVDSDDEMDDEGEEFDVNLMSGDGGVGRNGGNTSLVCIFDLLSANISFEFYFYVMGYQ